MLPFSTRFRLRTRAGVCSAIALGIFRSGNWVDEADDEAIVAITAAAAARAGEEGDPAFPGDLSGTLRAAWRSRNSAVGISSVVNRSESTHSSLASVAARIVSTTLSRSVLATERTLIRR
jgi:hypothetical protein